MDMEYINGQTTQGMKVYGSSMLLMGKENIFGLMGESIKVTGKTI
jgi:hypothetical protein